MCSDCEAYGLKRHGLTRSVCIRILDVGAYPVYGPGGGGGGG